MGKEREYDGVRKGSESTIEIDFYYAGQRCKERIKLQPTPANMKRASQHRAAILLAISNGTFDYLTTFPNSKKAKQFAKSPEAVGKTMADFLGEWLDEKVNKYKASTWDDYRKIVNNTLIPKIGSIQLTEFRRVDAKDLVRPMKCSNKRIANILTVLRSALDDAVEDELIDANPIKDFSYENQEAPATESDVDPFSKEEQALILEHCSGQVQNLFRFLFWTGLRTSEVVALDWSDIDFERGVITVSKAWTEVATEAEVPKTDAGRREVKILPPALQALNAQKPHTLLGKAEVFQNPTTRKRWSGDQVLRKGYWQPALVTAGVRYRRPYQTRHTYASMMLSAGEHPMWVARQMGHSSWMMISRIYGKWMPDAMPDAGSKASQLFGK